GNNFIHFHFLVGVFYEDHIFIVTLDKICEIVAQIIERAMPFGVIGLSDDVEVHATRKHVVDEEDGFVTLTTECNVKHHYHIWIHGLNCCSSCIDQLREIIKIAHVPIGPDYSMIDLISNLHHVGSCALLLEFHHHHVGVIV